MHLQGRTLGRTAVPFYKVEKLRETYLGQVRIKFIELSAQSSSDFF